MENFFFFTNYLQKMDSLRDVVHLVYFTMRYIMFYSDSMRKLFRAGIKNWIWLYSGMKQSLNLIKIFEKITSFCDIFVLLSIIIVKFLFFWSNFLSFIKIIFFIFFGLTAHCSWVRRQIHWGDFKFILLFFMKLFLK